jgi:hypothetical protein
MQLAEVEGIAFARHVDTASPSESLAVTGVCRNVATVSISAARSLAFSQQPTALRHKKLNRHVEIDIFNNVGKDGRASLSGRE